MAYSAQNTPCGNVRKRPHVVAPPPKSLLIDKDKAAFAPQNWPKKDALPQPQTGSVIRSRRCLFLQNSAWGDARLHLSRAIIRNMGDSTSIYRLIVIFQHPAPTPRRNGGNYRTLPAAKSYAENIHDALHAPFPLPGDTPPPVGLLTALKFHCGNSMGGHLGILANRAN